MLLGPSERRAEDDLASIRDEGLTARQLRMAARVAQRHGIETENEYEAVRLLRARGIDPFDRTSLLELVAARPGLPATTDAGVKLPQTVKPGKGLPGAPMVDEARRAAEIRRIQEDIARRRRRKTLMLFARLAVFVLLPTILTGIYFYRYATPLFATKSAFVIQLNEATGSGGGIGALFRGTQFATTQDAITVQSYLQSRDAMLRLDAALGFKTHFGQPSIDPIQRLSPDATNEAAYRLYQRNVKIGYDPTEGIITLEVIAADPLTSQKFAEALIGYAEEQVDQLSRRLREDQMKDARDSFADAEGKVGAAQKTVIDLQEKLGVLDPKTESTVIMNQVSTFEVELRKKKLELDQLLDNPEPNQARVDGAKGDISRLEALIAELRRSLTEDSATGASLASVSGQLRIAEADLETRQLMLGQAMQQLEAARIEANRQVRYLSVGVSPVAPDEPTYPRAFENTLLAFLVFGGIYLMLSLTAAILREQVAA
ncbi:MAG: capsule biosynthesis protein [Paracoccaceae bacterium]